MPESLGDEYRVLIISEHLARLSPIWAGPPSDSGDGRNEDMGRIEA